MDDVFAVLAERHGLEDRAGTSSDGLSERYLYSADMGYRYGFGRWWGHPDVATTDVWVLLNPATGDTERRRRPTLDRCIAHSRTVGRTGVVVVNIFALRHTDPKVLRRAGDPVGSANDDALRLFTAAAPRTIAAWGAGGAFHARSRVVAPLLDQPLCLGTTAGGEPRHPLYVPSDAELRPWTAPVGPGA
ncbi:DUF1643 domain-containing protein [Blastococcus montanus]|uniref:DUF1643 domain-containing protein n=1 Tax=Blastococcus montanus TaxID=3144973 RepID=UPI00320B67D7